MYRPSSLPLGISDTDPDESFLQSDRLALPGPWPGRFLWRTMNPPMPWKGIHFWGQVSIFTYGKKKKIFITIMDWIRFEMYWLLILHYVQHESSGTLDRDLCISEALRWQCFASAKATATATGMYCTILRFRGAVSFNQVPYPAGTVSSSSSCRRRPPWSRLLLALSPGSSQTLPHNLGAPPL